MKCRTNAKKQLRQFKSVVLKITLWKLSGAAPICPHTLAHICSDAPAEKRNGMFELDNTEFMCSVIHHVGWLMNYHHPRFGPGHTIVVTIVGYGHIRCHYSMNMAEKKQKRKKWLPVCCAATLIQPHGIFLPPKSIYSCTIYAHKQYECTERLPKQCKHVQLIGDESLVISRSAYWLDRYFSIGVKCVMPVEYVLSVLCTHWITHTHTASFTHNWTTCTNKKNSLASIYSPWWWSLWSNPSFRSFSMFHFVHIDVLR